MQYCAPELARTCQYTQFLFTNLLWEKGRRPRKRKLDQSYAGAVVCWRDRTLNGLFTIFQDMFCRWPVFEPLHWEIPWIRLSLGLKPEGQLETISLWQIWSTCISICENTTSIARRKMPKPLRVTVPISHYQKYTKPERRITSGAWRRIMRLRCYTHAPASAVHLVLAKSGPAMYLERLPRYRPDTESNT